MSKNYFYKKFQQWIQENNVNVMNKSGAYWLSQYNCFRMTKREGKNVSHQVTSSRIALKSRRNIVIMNS